MGSKYVIIVVAIAALVLLGMGIVKTAQRNNGGESSGEESSTVVTEVTDAPMRIPSRLHMPVPDGFSETSSELYEKFYIRNDASVIVSGGMQPGIGAQLESCIADVKKNYEAIADEYTLLSEDIISVGDMPCGLLEFTYAIVATDAKQSMQCLTALFVKDDYVYVITCKSRPETFGSYRETFRKTIEAVTIDDIEIPANAVVQGETPLTTSAQTEDSSPEVIDD